MGEKSFGEKKIGVGFAFSFFRFFGQPTINHRIHKQNIWGKKVWGKIYCGEKRLGRGKLWDFSPQSFFPSGYCVTLHRICAQVRLKVANCSKMAQRVLKGAKQSKWVKMGPNWVQKLFCAVAAPLALKRLHHYTNSSFHVTDSVITDGGVPYT